MKYGAITMSMRCVTCESNLTRDIVYFLFSAFVKQLVEELDLFDLECKLGMFRVRINFNCIFTCV